MSRIALPTGIVFALDCLIVMLSGLCGYALNHGLATAVGELGRVLACLAVCLVPFILSFLVFGSFKGTLRRTSVNDLLCITAAIILATALVTMMKMLGGKENITAVISLRDLLSLSCLSLILMSGMRLIARSAYDA